MGCSWSAEGVLEAREFNSDMSFGFAQNTASFGVGGTFGINRQPGCDDLYTNVVTPTMFWTDAVQETVASVTCAPITIDGASRTSIQCPVANTELAGDARIGFSIVDSGTAIGVGIRDYIFTVHYGVPPTGGVTSTTFTSNKVSEFPTGTTTVTETTIPPTCGVIPMAKRAACNADNVLRAFQQNSVSASSFCNTFTRTSATPGYSYPSYATAWSTTSERISSACTCLAGGTPAPPVATYNSPGCNADDPLRALRQNWAEASRFCTTYTLSTASAGYPYPKFVTSWSTTSARISSACSCFSGLSPNTNTIPRTTSATTTTTTRPTMMTTTTRPTMMTTTTSRTTTPSTTTTSRTTTPSTTTTTTSSRTTTTTTTTTTSRTTTTSSTTSSAAAASYAGPNAVYFSESTVSYTISTSTWSLPYEFTQTVTEAGPCPTDPLRRRY